MKLKANVRASVLILALWVLGFLSVLALQLGFSVRQRIHFVKRIEERSRLQTLVEGGAQRAMAVLMANSKDDEAVLGPDAKRAVHNDAGQFKQVALGDGVFDVSYFNEYSDTGTPLIKYGLADEQSKLNVNIASSLELRVLLTVGLGMDDDQAIELTNSIIGWRDRASTELVGFYSDAYYVGLDDPYPAKKANFELLDEMLLLKGMTPAVYEQLIPYVTVYGNGLVNINTAPRPVLLALGLSEDLVKKILYVRRGADGEEATGDDFVFSAPYNIVVHLRRFADVSQAEADQIDKLNFETRLATFSDFYMIQSSAELPISGEKKAIRCVFNRKDGRIEYWREY